MSSEKNVFYRFFCKLIRKNWQVTLVPLSLLVIFSIVVRSSQTTYCWCFVIYRLLLSKFVGRRKLSCMAIEDEQYENKDLKISNNRAGLETGLFVPFRKIGSLNIQVDVLTASFLGF